MSTPTITTKAVMQAFGVSHMSVAAWRDGVANKDPLPTVDTDGRAVRFSPAKVKAWAKRNGRVIVDETALEPDAVRPEKPGPKAAPVKKSALRTRAKRQPTARERQRAAVSQVMAAHRNVSKSRLTKSGKLVVA